MSPCNTNSRNGANQNLGSNITHLRGCISVARLIMDHLVDSTDRRPLDYFSFGLMAAGELIGAAGVVTLHPLVFILGGVLVTFGLIYFFLLD
jgi:hypothetical protein